MYSRTKFLKCVRKTVSFTLAVFLFVAATPIRIHAQYDDPNTGGYLTNSSVTANYSPTSLLNLKDGSFSQSIQIQTPAGRQGQKPYLSIQYSSANRNESIVGYAWNLETVSISRFQDGGTEKLYGQYEKFTSSIDGELVSIGNNQYHAKREGGSFRLYSKNGDNWSIKEKDGTTLNFNGLNGGAVDTADSSRIGQWNLTSQTDLNGNEIQYQYSTSSGVAILEEISYVSLLGENNLVSIEFLYETRPDTIISYKYGFKSTLTKRLAEILIDINNGNEQKEYSFAYEAGDNAERSLLKSVTEDGVREIYNFEYSNHVSGWQGSSAFDAPTDFITSGGFDNGSRFGDVNGDGRPDIVYMKGHFQNGGPAGTLVFLNTANGWATSSSFSVPEIGGGYGFTMIEITYQTYRDGGGELVDINGDGYADFIWGHVGGFNSHTYNVDVDVRETYINNQDGTWSLDSNYAVPGDIVFTLNHNDAGTRLVDLNGDGLVDLLRTNLTVSPRETVAYLNTGSGWATTTGWSIPSSIINHTQVLNHLKFADVNNDSLVDMLFAFNADDANQYYAGGDTINVVYLNTGSDWAIESSLSVPTYFGYIKITTGNAHINSFTHLVDMNADGLVDIANSAPSLGNWYGIDLNSKYLNTQSGWEASTSAQVGQGFAVKKYQSNYGGFVGSYPLDIDGDLVTDYLRSGPTYGSGSYVVRDTVLDTGTVSDILEKVTKYPGGTVEITYSALNEMVDSGTYVHDSSPINHLVVTQEKHDSLYAPDQIIEYEYVNPHFYYQSATEREFAGFAEVHKKSELSQEIVYFHQGNSISTTSEETTDGESLIGKVYKKEVKDLSGNLYQLKRYNYSTSSIATSSTFVKLESEVTLDFDGDGDEKASAVSYTYSNDHGSLLTQREWGEVAGETDGTFSDVGVDDKETVYEYAASSSGLVLPTKRTLKDDSGNKVAESRYYYDNQSLGSVSVGNLTKQENWVSGNTYLDTEWTYDLYGNVLSETDARNNTINFEYDTFNLFVASTSNAKGHNNLYEYDYLSGQVATTTNLNGEVFITLYDGFGRPLKHYAPDPQSGSQTLVSEYIYTDTAGAVKVQKTDYLSSTLSHNSFTYFDGFGKVIQERVESENSNEYTVKDYIYGDNGLLDKETLPYFSAGSAFTTATTNNNLYSTYGYDPLSRIASVNTVVGTTTNSYDQWKEMITDTVGNERELTYDAFGRLEQVTEYEGANSYNTDYDWDDLDNLIKITDADGNIRNISYDGLSRRTELEDLHDPTDSTFGTWDFTYDDVGNLTSMTDPNSQTVNYTYDDINRKLTEDYTGQSGTEVTYSYDSCTNGIGYLCTVGNSSATTSYAYTPNGLVESESKFIAGTTYTTSYEYDRLGNQTLIVYPDNSEVQYTYHKGNKVNQIEQKESGGTFTDVIENVTYGPHGQIEYLKHGNGSETTRTYNASELYRLSGIITTATSSFGTGGPGVELTQVEAELAEFPVIEEEVVFDSVEEPTEAVAEESLEVEELSKVSEEGVLFETLEEIVEIIDISTSTELEVIETASSTTESETIATTTRETPQVVFEIASSSEEVELLETLIASTSETTTAIADEVIDESKKVRPPKQKLDTAHHIKNVHDAKVWRKYHKERLAGIAEELGTDSSAYKKAEEAAEEFELQLYDEKYITELDGEITGTKLEWVREKSKKGLEALVSFLLPEKLHAYVFGTEDFESCSSLPCNASYAPTWGGGALSLDSSSQVEGDDSLEQSFSSQGGAWLEYTSMAEDEVYVQFKVYLPSSMSWGTSGYYNVLRLEDSNNNEIFSAKIEDWGSARLTLIGDVFPWTNTNIDLTTGAVNTIEVRFKKGTSGAVDVWLDNSTEGSPDYATSSANTGTDDVNDIQVGVTYAPESISTTYTDDITIDTAFIGSLGGGGGTSTPPITVPFVEIVQDLSYEYDSVGNITKIVDISGTDSAATTTYIYDDLYRLTSASTSQASTSPYARTYTYSPIGNILTKSDIGMYTYGTSGGGGSGTSTETIYDDSLASAWDNWSWGGTYSFSSTDVVESGTYAIEATYTSQYGGLQLRNGSIDTSAYDDLEFNIYIESGSSINLQVKSYNKNTNTQLGQVSLSNYLPSGTYTTGVWRNVSIPLSAIGFDNFSGNGAIVIQSDGSPTVVVHFDNIELVSESSGGGGGSSSTGNPHAASTINGVSQAYDYNGNLTETGDGNLYSWSYKNELVQAVNSNGTTTYKYDHDGQRVSKAHGTSTVIYPFGHYEVKDGEINKHIYLEDMLVATVQYDTPSPKIYHNHLDHLGSTNAVTGPDGYLNQSLAYYPFGGMRVDNTYDSINQNNRFTSHDYDSQTDFTYMGARYYAGDTGRFTSQDPVSLALGDWGTVQDKTMGQIGFYLQNPQTHNSYSYTANNPLKYVDSNGEFLHIAAGALGGGLLGLASQGVSDIISGQYSGYQEYVGAAAGGAVVGGTAAGTGGMSLLVAGGVGFGAGVADGVVTEGLKVADGTQESINTQSIGNKAVLGGVTGALPIDLKIKGVTAGRNSNEAIMKQISTKYANGTIGSIAPSTGVKIGSATMVHGLPGEVATIGLEQFGESAQSTPDRIRKKDENR